MKPFRSLTLLLLALVAAPAAADPVVVTFDTLTGDNRQVPDGYGGINWLDNWTHYAFTQYLHVVSHADRAHGWRDGTAADNRAYHFDRGSYASQATHDY